MSSRIVRNSKFRHVFGTGAKKDQCYDGLRITKSNWEGSTYCSVNTKFVAIIVESAGGGAFIVIPLSTKGRIERDCPVVGGHKADVLDLKWCPHHEEVIASCSEDCTVKVWQIPEDGLKESLNEPIVDLVYHQRKVGLIEWHPTASNILVSAGADLKMLLWDVGTGEVLSELVINDVLFSISFNMIGNKLVTACKDKKVRVHNARDLTVLQEGQAHEGSKACQAIFLKDDRVFTTGFTRMSERQFCVFAKEGENSLGSGDGPLTHEEIDNSNGVVFIFYDPDTNLVYLAGKGDSVIRYLEIVDEAPYAHWIAMYKSNVPQRGIGFLPKRGVNVNICEIARFYKLSQGSSSQGGMCEPISFTVPRKSELFQDDIYPDTFSGEPSLTSDEWFVEKTDAEPELMSMKELFHSAAGAKKAKVRSSVLTAGKKKTTPKSEVDGANKDSSAPGNDNSSAKQSSVSEETITELLNEIRKLKIIVMGHEKRIGILEGKSSDSKHQNGQSTDKQEEIQTRSAARKLQMMIKDLKATLYHYGVRIEELEVKISEYECAV